jgi:hydroxymethylbilane synthase
VTPGTLRIATRGSALARWQADHVASLLRAVDPSIKVELLVVRTEGDQRLDVPIWEIGGKGVFVAEVRAAVLNGDADLAVHSAKDLPSVPLDGLTLAAVPERADVRDALVGARLDDLAPGALVATGSNRRRTQLGWRRPDLRFTGLRGNIGTRLDKVGHDGIDAVVVAVAALDRLGLSDRIDEALDPAVLLPQVGQGALAVECSTSAPAWLGEVLGAIDHGPSHRRVDAERAFLAELGGDCDLPAGALAELGADDRAEGGDLTVTGLLASLDGQVVLRHSATGADAQRTGAAVARHLLDIDGGAALLAPRS